MATQQLSRKTSAGKELIYCELRADYRTATPEEIVRQEYIQADDFFAANDRLEVSESTFGRIIKLLERFNLSTTSDDVKRIAPPLICWRRAATKVMDR